MASAPEDPATSYSTSWPEVKYFMVRSHKTIAEMGVYCASCHHEIETDEQEEPYDAVVNSCGHIFHGTCLALEFRQVNSKCPLCNSRNYYRECRCLIPYQPLPKDRTQAILLSLTRPENGRILPKCHSHLIEDALKRLCHKAFRKLKLDRYIPPPPVNLVVATDGTQTVVFSSTYTCYGYGTFENLHADELPVMQAECRREFQDLDASMRRSWGHYGRLQWAPEFKVGVITYRNRGYDCQNCSVPQCQNTKDRPDKPRQD